ncbi:hypothetical protein WA026_019828 [Henosepilachna vigintioctopunctata]|uniref:Uncharacterized protein n=1 Tax=Henosepilachna vigintioctopunctata TaxID=420089 RepID=A0AAW1V9I3_9CUCU
MRKSYSLIKFVICENLNPSGICSHEFIGVHFGFFNAFIIKIDLTSRQRCDARDVIKESLNDQLYLSALALSVVDVVIEKLNDKFDALLLKVGDLEKRVTKLKTENVNLRRQMNRVEHNQRTKRLRFIGVPEKGKEDLLDSVTLLLLKNVIVYRTRIRIKQGLLFIFQRLVVEIAYSNKKPD